MKLLEKIKNITLRKAIIFILFFSPMFAGFGIAVWLNYQNPYSIGYNFGLGLAYIFVGFIITEILVHFYGRK